MRGNSSALRINTYELLPKGNRLARPGLVTVSIGPPIHPPELAPSTEVEARYAVYQEMAGGAQQAVEALGRPGRSAHV